ncbi:NTP transferase domain-containing protein, partial [Gordonia sp. (in: high G+C Gram-positive bacteria)]|uniref:NTP transferase domain-containing protein n=1 Tax=Gordonia sp. (in: high G+C Gram-positive bacteria) TaxID=84139 RepID=UPI002FDAD0B3
MTDIAVIVLAAGAGTRMKSKTPKILHTLAGRSLLGHALHGAAGLSPKHLVTVVGHKRRRVSAAVDEIAAQLGIPVTIVEQPKPRGTGDAASVGLGGLPAGFTGTVVVTAADVPLLDTATLNAVIGTHMAGRGAAVTLTSFIADDPAGYGRIVRSGKSVKAIVEHKDASKKQLGITEVNAGVYAFDATLLRHALTKVSSDNAQGEFYLTDVIAIARKAGGTVRAHIVDDPYLVAGCNDRAQLSDLAAEVNRRIIRAHQLEGVTVVDP